MKVYTKNSGFTLIEILITLFIVSIVFGILYGSFYSTYGVIKAFEDKVDSDRPLWGSIHILSDDLRGSFFSPTYKDSRFKGNKVGNGSSMPFLSFTAFTPYKGYDVSAAPLIEYYFEGDGDKNSIVRRVYNSKDSSDIDEEEILSGVSDLDIFYDDGSDLKDEWDAGVSKKLPAGVKLSIKYNDYTADLLIKVEGG